MHIMMTQNFYLGISLDEQHIQILLFLHIKFHVLLIKIVFTSIIFIQNNQKSLKPMFILQKLASATVFMRTVY